MNRKASMCAIELIKFFESCKLTAYKDNKGVLTIGYGHTKNVKAGQKITKQQAEKYLLQDIEKFEKAVNKYNSIYNFSQNEFDALISFAFNIGSITQLTNSGKRTKKEIAEKITHYNKCAGKELAGLTKRRTKEKELFINSTQWFKVCEKWFYYELGEIIKKSWIYEMIDYNGTWYYLTETGEMATYSYIKSEYKELYYWVNEKGEYEEQWDTEKPNLKKYKVVK